MSGTRRCNIVRGSVVSIVLKRDQKTGKLAKGTVDTVLTNSENHHRGIKVKLSNGMVGRVQQIHENSQETITTGQQSEQQIPQTERQDRYDYRKHRQRDDCFVDQESAPSSASGIVLYDWLGSSMNFRRRETSWNCSACTFENNNALSECEMCGAVKETQTKAHNECVLIRDVSTTVSSNSTFSTMSEDRSWNCRACTFENSFMMNSCEICGSKR